MRFGDDRAMAPSRRRTLLVVGAALMCPAALEACGSTDKGLQGDATERLMLQHGLLTRLLALYRRSALTLRINPAVLDAKALAEAAGLFRAFGEDFHERALEETFVFPALQRAGGALAAMTGVMQQQHERGRAITDFILSQCASGAVDAAQAEAAARALESMADMYEAHAAFEETVVYPAWRKTLSEPQWRDMGQRFASLQLSRFKTDDFAPVQLHVTALEHRLGAPDSSVYTAPSPAADP
jgi:hemerythrin-like domain-containing protein